MAHRHTLARVLACLGIAAGVAWAQQPESKLALLIRNPHAGDGESPYALADDYGRVRRLVEASSRYDLEPYIGQRVRIKHDTGRTLLASQLDLSGVGFDARPEDLQPVSPAQFVPPGRVAPTTPGERFPVRPVQAQSDGSITIDPPASSATAEPILIDELPLPQLRQPMTTEVLPPVRHGDDIGPSFTTAAPTTTMAAACTSCDTKGCPSCCPASERGMYGRAEYLLWWVDGMDTPPLATTNAAGATPTLDDADTSVIAGGSLLSDSRNGFRLALGGWFDDQRNFALEGDWTILETESADFQFSDPSGIGTLGRPYYDVVALDEAALVIAQPAAFGGTLNIRAESELESFGIRARTGVACQEFGGGPACGSGGGLLGRRRQTPAAISRVDFLAGLRYSELQERLAFNYTQTPLTGAGAGTTTTGNESFSVDNDFYGVELGGVYDWKSSRWGVELVSKIAIGGTTQHLRVRGSQTDPLGVTTDGALLAQPSNIGVFERDRFSVVPEVSARVSYQVAPRLTVSAAYSLIYWSNVIRPGDQIDYSVQLPAGPGPSDHPRVDLEETAFWAHGLNFGVDYRY